MLDLQTFHCRAWGCSDQLLFLHPYSNWAGCRLRAGCGQGTGCGLGAGLDSGWRLCLQARNCWQGLELKLRVTALLETIKQGLDVPLWCQGSCLLALAS